MAHGPDSIAGTAEDFRAGSVRGTAGFFRVAQQVAGPWWLLDAEGRPVFLKAVNGVRPAHAETDIAPAHAPVVRLRQWGFNAVGTGGDGSGRDDGLAFLGGVDFCRTTTTIVAAGVRLPDVFDPDWPARAATRAAEVCGPAASNRELVGWVTDDALGWGSPASANRPGLLQTCLSLEPAFATYHAAWEFALASHGGKLDALSRAWGVSVPNKETVRELTRAETGIATRGYLRDEARWAREFARRYFGDTAAAIRAADGNHLVLGCRFAAPVGEAVTDAATYPAVDVALRHWLEVPAAGAATAPLLASDVAWSTPAFWTASATEAKRPARLTSVERMLRRARTALKRLARHPAAVGYVWGQWHDEPGEQPPFARGLVHANGTEAREHTELLVEFNARADTLRRGAAKLLSP